ncbi:MAG: pentapeptide repeat-containing protein [Candidatus Azobacteroides sp.]|nr:pentapeptide repeat-containing protein [Candidatus Azobacteroides sp.]
MNKIEIKDANGKILFELEGENNTAALTLSEAVKEKVNLSCANLYRVNLQKANLRGANLCRVNLQKANLRGANLCRVNLCYADLRGADLCSADLRGADLCSADLQKANLYMADLSGADIDFSSLHFSCNSLKAKTDERQRIQLGYHFLSWIKYSENATDEEKQIFEFCKEYANKFHRADVDRF